MTISIRELKRRYKLNLALGRVLPTFDLATPLPLSTGNPLFDAALTDKLTMTATLSEAEHVSRAWRLVCDARDDDLVTLARYSRRLLNDYKLLLALRAWRDGDVDRTGVFVRAMPWGWRFAFPTAVIKPAAVIFTGWRRDLRFRLVEEPRFDALRAFYRNLLAQAPGVAVLKYRQSIQQALALLRYRPEGERERAIHDLCFNRGRGGYDDPSLEPVGTYRRACTALAAQGVAGMLRELENSPHEIPITSYMGLLGNAGVRLTDSSHVQSARLRAYALRCATAVESLLRLAEWSPWLTDADVQVISAKVRRAVEDEGIDIPFFNILKAFLAAPLETRRRVLHPLLIPLMKRYGRQVAGLLGESTPLTFVQPGNIIHLMSFLLYTVVSSVTPTRLLLLYKDGAEEMPPLDLDDVAAHLADAPKELETWLLRKFGGLVTDRTYVYDYSAVAHTLQRLDPHAPLMLDLPFAESLDLLAALMPFERVFNLNAPFGAPGELCIAYEYYQDFGFATSFWKYSVWSRYSDSAAQRFAECLDRLHSFQMLANEVQVNL